VKNMRFLAIVTVVSSVLLLLIVNWLSVQYNVVKQLGNSCDGLPPHATLPSWGCGPYYGPAETEYGWPFVDFMTYTDWHPSAPGAISVAANSGYTIYFQNLVVNFLAGLGVAAIFVAGTSTLLHEAKSHIRSVR